MPFPRDKVSELLVQCHRRCCICHRFCGVKIETDHIKPLAEGGTDDIENAIPVCFECHAEIHSYNDKHPRGRKFTVDELVAHKKQWLKICQDNPGMLVNASRNVDVGPLQALIDELEFNSAVGGAVSSSELGCSFQTRQFLRAVEQGSISILKQEVLNSVIEAYRVMGAANTTIQAMWQLDTDKAKRQAETASVNRLKYAKPKIDAAKQLLLEFLGSEKDA